MRNVPGKRALNKRSISKLSNFPRSSDAAAGDEADGEGGYETEEYEDPNPARRKEEAIAITDIAASNKFVVVLGASGSPDPTIIGN